MKNEKIITAWNSMNPDSAAKEKILRQLQSAIGADLRTDNRAAVKTDGRHTMRKTLARFAIGFAATIILLLGSFGTAYAASPAFREYVRSLFFLLYTSDEFVSIENGHLTGSFDKTDVLLSFLDCFNRCEFGNSITATMDEGYHYSLFTQSEDKQNGQHLQAFVDSSTDGYCIVVFMERLEYKDTEGIWQITGYQILESAAAEAAKSGLIPYSESSLQAAASVPQENASTQDAASASQENASLQATEDTILIYNVNDKKNTAALAENDSSVLHNILDNCDRLETIEGGLFQYVLKTNGISCLFDSQGKGIITESANHQGIMITEENLKTIMELFEQYGISLEETK